MQTGKYVVRFNLKISRRYFEFPTKTVVYVFSYRRVYRADARTTQQPADLPYGDNPPTYSDVTGIVDETQQSKMDKYKNKGKEILAKVTLYKNTSN